MAGCYCMGKADDCTCDARCRCECDCEFTKKYKTWGEVFATVYDDDPDLEPLELVYREQPTRPYYKLDIDDSQPWENPGHKKPPNCS